MKKHNNSEHSAFKRFVRFLKKNRGSYVSVCLVVVLIILIGKAVESSINNGGFDLKTYLPSIIDLKTFVTIVLVFILTGIASLIGGLFAPKVEDMMKLTTNYDMLAKKYGVFSELIKYTNSGASDSVTGRKNTTSKAKNYNNGSKKYDGNEDKYDFPTIKLVSLYDKRVDIIFDFDTANVYKQPSWVSSHSDALFAAHSHSEIYNQQNFRLDNITWDKRNVKIYLSKTSYLDSLITNRACDYEINGVSVRELYEPGPVLHDLKDSQLSNHLGYNGMVETSDHKFIFIKRHKKVSIAKNTWQTSVGASLKVRNALTKDRKVDTDSIANAIVKEMMSEFNLKNLDNSSEIETKMKSDFSFKKNVLYFYRDLLECGKPQMMFYYQLPISSEEVAKAFTNGIGAAKKNRDRFSLFCDIDGHKLMFIDREDLNKLYLTPDGFAFNKKFYKSVPSAVATIVMLLEYFKEANN